MGIRTQQELNGVVWASYTRFGRGTEHEEHRYHFLAILWLRFWNDFRQWLDDEGLFMIAIPPFDDPRLASEEYRCLPKPGESDAARAIDTALAALPHDMILDGAKPGGIDGLLNFTATFHVRGSRAHPALSAMLASISELYLNTLFYDTSWQHQERYEGLDSHSAHQQRAAELWRMCCYCFTYMLERVDATASNAMRGRLTPRTIAALVARVGSDARHDSITLPLGGAGTLAIPFLTADRSLQVSDSDRRLLALTMLHFLMYGHRTARMSLCSKTGESSQRGSRHPAGVNRVSYPGSAYRPLVLAQLPLDPVSRTDAQWDMLTDIVSGVSAGAGRALVIVTPGLLAQSRFRHALHERFCQDGLLTAVVMLPSNLYFNVVDPVALLVFDGHEAVIPFRGEVLMMDASRCCLTAKTQTRIPEEDIERIAGLLARREHVSDGRIEARRVDHAALGHAQFDWLPSRYLGGDTPSPEDDIDVLRREIVDDMEQLRKARKDVARLVRKWHRFLP